MLNIKKNILNIKRRLKLAKTLGLDFKIFILPVLFALFATFFEGITVAALVPFVRGVISRDFQFIKVLPVFNKIGTYLTSLVDLSNTNIFIILLFIVFLAAVSKNILLYLSQLSLSYQLGKAVSKLRLTILDHYVKFGKMFFDRNSTGNLQNLLSHFSAQIGSQLSVVNGAINALFMLIMYITAMFLISWRITILVLLVLPILNLLLRQLIIKIRKSSEYVSRSSMALSGKLFNILSCMTLVKLYNNEMKEKECFRDFNERLRQAEFSIKKKVYLLQPLQEIAFLFIIMLLVSLMAYLFVKEKAGHLSGYLIYFYLLRRAQGSIGVFNNLKSAIAEVGGPIKYIKGILSDEEKFIISQGSVHCSGFKENVQFNRLSFSYYKGRQVLSDVSFSVKKGEKLAIVGSTGSGKTTLVNLLLRFYDCPPGSIYIDGVDIRDFTTASLLELFAYVSQETLLFSDTLRNNILYGLKYAPREERINEVLNKARLFDFVLSLPNGLNTYIGDRGVRLSGGEKQRVAIARVMLKGSDILILDEATSSLDSKTERLVQESIEEAIREKTVIVIAHRLSTIKNVDKIVVIEGGRLIEEGSLNELLEKKGKFYEYWQEQKFY